MAQKLLDRYDRYCQTTLANLKEFDKYSTETLQKELISGKWTLAQVIDHLLSIEKAVYMYMAKKSADPALKTVKFKNKFYHFLTKLVLKSGKKVKAPSVVPDPSNEKDLNTMIAELEKIRTRTRSFIAEWPTENQHKLIFRHPMAGMFTLSQTVEFVAEHWNHHLPQQRALVAKITA